MINRVKTYLQFGNQFCGIEHTSLNDDEKIQSVVLKKSKKEVVIENLFHAKSIEGLAKQLPKNQHAWLIVNDSNIITKKVDNEQDDVLKIVQKAYPNLKMNDFYFEVIQEDKNCFVSIGRKEYIDSIIEAYLKLKINVIDISVGNSMVSSISGFLDVSEIHTSNALIELENDTIKSIEQLIEFKDGNYNVNGLEIKNNSLLSLSGALSSILNNYDSETNSKEKKKLLLDDFTQFRFYTQFLKFGLVFILGLLLINFLLFNNYYNKVNTLKQTAQINHSTKKNVFQLNESVRKKEKMVEDMFNSNNSKSSFYANSIIHSLPNTIILNEFDYQPLLKRIKSDKPIENEKRAIMIAGVSNNSESFSKWLMKLKVMPWVENTTILEYGTKSNASSSFSIKIEFKDDE